MKWLHDFLYFVALLSPIIVFVIFVVCFHIDKHRQHKKEIELLERRLEDKDLRIKEMQKEREDYGVRIEKIMHRIDEEHKKEIDDLHKHYKGHI